MRISHEAPTQVRRAHSSKLVGLISTQTHGLAIAAVKGRYASLCDSANRDGRSQSLIR